MPALWFVLLPLGFYVPMFLYETFVAFRRIGKPLDEGGEYLHATWESTHTFLVLSFNYFIWLYSSAVVAVAAQVYVPLFIFGAVFIARGVLYTQLFYIKPSQKPSFVIDSLFAWTHVLIIGTLGITVFEAARITIENRYQANEILVPLLLPGLILLIPLISVPLYFLYKTKSR